MAKKKECNHKYGAVNSNGYQYCVECNLARYVPKVCEHVWKIIEQREVTNIMYNSRIGFIYVQECDKCGEIKSEKISLY